LLTTYIEQGAGELSKRVEEIYGPDGIELIVDEGGGVAELYGTRFAAISTSEKGYLDGT
jgi:Gly-Xaa carboxypeptidase